MKRTMTINGLSAGLALAVFAMSSLPVAAAPTPVPSDWWLSGSAAGIAVGICAVSGCFEEHRVTAPAPVTAPVTEPAPVVKGHLAKGQLKVKHQAQVP